MTALVSPLKVAFLASATLALSTVTAVGVSSAGAATVPHFCYQGHGYGTSVHVGTAVASGRSAPSGLGCTDRAGLHVSNSAVGLTRAPLLRSGTVVSAVSSHSSPVRTYATAATQRVSLLSGLVHADAVTAASVTSYRRSFAVSGAGTSLAHLVIAGVPIPATPAPNTRVNLAGFGYVILNQQTRKITPSSASLTVNAIHLYITASNTLKIAAHTDVVVSSATSALTGPVAGLLAGHAYGSSLTALGNLANAGPSFAQYLGCLGTGGKRASNIGAGATVTNVVSVHTITDTARGSVTASTASGDMTSTVQNADLLHGLVHATAITADAHASTNGTSRTLSSAGSHFGSLSVRGFPRITAHVPANTSRTISGLGTLYLHRIIRTRNGIEVRMIELVLSKSINGLPIGTDIRVAVAGVSTR